MKKIYQIIMLCAMCVSLIGCGKSANDYEKQIDKAIEETDFNNAHELLKDFLHYLDASKESKGADGLYERQYAYTRSERKLYTTEIGYLLEQGDNSTNERIISLLKELNGHRVLTWAYVGDGDQITMNELNDYLIANAINLHKDELIEKFFSSGVAWSSSAAGYLLENNENAPSILISSLSRLGSFSVPSAGHYYHSGYSEREVEDFGIKINDYNEACMYLINQAIIRKNKDLALQAQALIKEDLSLYNYNISYYSTTKHKAEEKINEAIEKGVFDE